MTGYKKYMEKNIAIKLSHVYKKYTIHHDKPTLMENIINGKGEEFWALRDVSLEINKGEWLGVVGLNGSGKTTLLKLICGISSPTKGKINTQGKIVSLIDIGAGFHPDLTGVQNVFINGMLLGMSKNYIERTLNSIVEFADIGKFIDVPLFTYSEGMKLRLGFSIAVNMNFDTLVLDENFYVGDKNFQLKMAKRIEEVVKQKKTIIVASHDWLFLKDHCTKVVVVDKGRITDFGKSKQVLKRYLERRGSEK